jgi:Ras family protein A
MALFDTAGQDDANRLCPLSYLSYPSTNIALLCFSVSDSISLVNVLENWNSEIRHFCGQCPVILVACKTDLRTDSCTIEMLERQGKKPVTTEEGRKIAAQIKADAYMECSAKTGEGVHDLFVHAARLSLEKRPHNRRSNRKCYLY